MVALVAAGSMTGSARVLQNGVLSNAAPFTVNTLHITSLNPASGAPGTSVTFTGAGFGSTQGSGIVWLGSTAGQVASWSDTQVVATVAPTAVTGIARIQQNGVWSNALTFTVPVSGGNAVTLSPNLLTMLVGDTHTIQALNSSGQPVTGLTWTSSDPTVVSLSTDDPPLLTALAVGHVTITAGTASADVTVSPGDPNYPGTLPLGTVLWSVPGSVTKIVPAVPSPSGVADVFAIQCPDPTCSWGPVSVQAITSDGTTAWAASLGDAYPILPDFLGGLVFIDNDTGSVAKVDGTTGQINTLYSLPGQTYAYNIAVHTDGTIFAVLVNNARDYTVIGIDPTTGSQKFSVPVPQVSQGQSEVAGGPIIAGDGYAYVPHFTTENVWTMHIGLLRIDSSGAYEDIHIADWTDTTHVGDLLSLTTTMITNADQGVLLSWEAGASYYVFGLGYGQPSGGMAITTGTGVALMNVPEVGDWPFQPVLQAQDGSFVGTVAVGSDQNNNPLSDMVSFDQTGAIRWMVPGNYQPQIATADGGLIATDPSGAAYTFDQNGNATGVLAGSPVQSWTNQTYTSVDGQTADVVLPITRWAASYQAEQGGNPSSNGTSVGVAESVEGLPVFALKFWGPSCQWQAGGGVKVPLGGTALTQYGNERQQLLGGNYLASGLCASFFTAPARAPYFVQLVNAITNGSPGLPVPFDGLQSNLSMYDAGMISAADLSNPRAVSIWKGTPVCSRFVSFYRGQNGRQTNLGIATAASHFIRRPEV